MCCLSVDLVLAVCLRGDSALNATKRQTQRAKQTAFPFPSETDMFLAVRRHAKCTVTPPTMMQI